MAQKIYNKRLRPNWTNPSGFYSSFDYRSNLFHNLWMVPPILKLFKKWTQSRRRKAFLQKNRKKQRNKPNYVKFGSSFSTNLNQHFIIVNASMRRGRRTRGRKFGLHYRCRPGAQLFGKKFSSNFSLNRSFVSIYFFFFLK